MAYNFVLVTMSLAFIDGSTSGVGKIVFEVDDFVLDTSTGSIVIVPTIQFSSEGGNVSNPIQVPFLAMDDPNLSRNWSWILTAELSGRQDPLPKRKLAINSAAGQQQLFKDIFLAGTPA